MNHLSTGSFGRAERVAAEPAFRGVLHAYADLTQPWMAHSDARMGRKLVGFVERSTLTLADLDTQVRVASYLSPLVADRIDNISAALAAHPSLARDVQRWRNEVDDAIAARIPTR